jgi:hypothetical protein
MRNIALCTDVSLKIANGHSNAIGKLLFVPHASHARPTRPLLRIRILNLTSDLYYLYMLHSHYNVLIYENK